MDEENMKIISRDEAETLLLKNEVLSSHVDQDKNEMRIIFILSNNASCRVIYNLASHQKSYAMCDT